MAVPLVAARQRVTARWSARVFVIAFASNFVWEMAQAYLYEPMGSAWEASRRCLAASIGDAAMVLIVLASTRAVTGRASVGRQYTLAAVLGAVVAIAVEWWGLAQGRWAYLPEMPRVPGTAMGVVPLLQMAILTPLTMWSADRLAGRT